MSPSPQQDVATASADDPRLLTLLGIVPLIGGVTSLLAGLSLGLASLLMLCAASTIVAAARRRLSVPLRLPAILVLSTALASIVTALFAAFLYEEYLALTIALPLLAINVVVIEQAEAAASRSTTGAALADATRVGARLVLLLAALGALRELLGQGTLLDGAEAFGERLAAVTVQLFPSDAGFALALAPAGGFILLGLLLGARNALALRRAAADAA